MGRAILKGQYCYALATSGVELAECMDADAASATSRVRYLRDNSQHTMGFEQLRPFFLQKGDCVQDVLLPPDLLKDWLEVELVRWSKSPGPPSDKGAPFPGFEVVLTRKQRICYVLLHEVIKGYRIGPVSRWTRRHITVNNYRAGNLPPLPPPF